MPSSRAGGSGRSMSANRPSISVGTTANSQTGKSPANTSGTTTVITRQTRNSRSVCATPLRTPLRSSSAPPATAEKDRKAANNELATHLMDKLHSHPQFRTEFLPNGLRAITTKQFVSTLLFFMRSVVGNARGQKLPADISTDDIGKWLTQIRYPHLQSRSWLKTPNVPHAFHHLVELVNWLATFIPDDAADPMPSFALPDNHIDVEQCFPSLGYICAFLGELRDMFVMWNQDQNTDVQKRRLTEQFVQERMPHLPNALDHINAETARIRHEVDEMGGSSDGIAPLTVDPAAEAELERQLKRLRTLEADEQRLRDTCRTKNRAQRTAQSDLKAQQRHNQQLDTDCRELTERVQTQRMGVKRRDELLHLVHQRRIEAAAKRTSNEEQRVAGHERHLAYTSRMKRQIAVFTAVKQRVHAVGELLQADDLLEWSPDCRVGAKEFGERLQSMVHRFDQMCAADEERLAELRRREADIDAELNALRTDVAIMETRKAELDSRAEQLSERRTELESLLGMTRVDFAKMRGELRTELDAMSKKTVEISERLRVDRERFGALEVENERMMVELERIGNELIDEKQRRLTKGYALLEELDMEIRKAQADLDKVIVK